MIRVHIALLFLPVLLFVFPVSPAEGQSLIHLYRSAYGKARLEQLLERQGNRVMPMPPAHVPSPSDSIQQWLATSYLDNSRAASGLPMFEVTHGRRVRKPERSWFRKTFRETKWAYLGSNTITPLDTTFTWKLRAQLQAHFGPPTQTLADIDTQRDNPKNEEYIEFEYWFVLNDSIPFVVMDVNGPFERGLVVASDQRYRHLLFDLRHVFLERLVHSDRLAPYVDYYYDPENNAWYRTGYNGTTFFLRRIPRPLLGRGRPMLNQQDG